MKILKLFTLVFFVSLSGYTQVKTGNKKEINLIMTAFMRSLIKKDSVTFYSLFNDEPVTWVGVYKERTQKIRIGKDSNALSYFTDTYKDFFRSLSGKDKYEEKFNDVKIIEDESIASVTFRYSFWINGKLYNWGSEYWGLMKSGKKWKITSVIFTIELAQYFEQEALKNAN